MPERAAAAALAGDHHEDRRVQDRHLAQVQRDRLGDATLFGLHARVGGRRVHQADHRPAELLGHLHGAQRLPVALGTRVAEVARDLLLGVAALLVTDDQHRLIVVLGKAGDDGLIVAEAPIAVDLGEPGPQPRHVVEQVRPLRVARHEHALPRRQPGEQVLPDLPGPRLQPGNLAGPFGRRRLAAELVDLLQECSDGLLELEGVHGHDGQVTAV